MEIFEIIGTSFGIVGFIVGMGASSKIEKLEKRLREKGMLDEDPK